VEQPLRSGSLVGASKAGVSHPPMRPLPIEDERALSDLRRGNWGAMEGLVQRYQDRLYVTVLRMVGHPEDAADLVQETFVRAMQNIARFEGKSSLYTWLFRIAVNLSISHRRSRSYRDAVSLDFEESTGRLDQQASTLREQLTQYIEDDPAFAAAMRLEHERLIKALGKLEPEFRAVIVLRDIEDCDYDQISAILEVPVGTIKSRLFRARTALRNIVTDNSAV